VTDEIIDLVMESVLRRVKILVPYIMSFPQPVYSIFSVVEKVTYEVRLKDGMAIRFEKLTPEIEQALRYVKDQIDG